jgi:hypothetical protein
MPRRLPSSSLDKQSILTAIDGTLASPQGTLSGYWKLDQTLTGDITGNADTATKWKDAVVVNGTNLAGNVTPITIGVNTTTISTSGTYYPIFVLSNTAGNQQASTNTSFSYDPNTGYLSASRFVGSGAGLTNIVTSLAVNGATAATGAVAITTVASVASGTGVTVSGTGSGPYTGAVTVAIGQAVATDSDVRFGSIGVGIAAPGSNNVVVQGNVTAYSDIRLKDNIETITDALNKITQVRGVTYTRTDMEDTLTRHTGVIAQELESVLPEAVMTGSDGIKSVAYGNVIGLLIESIKELNAKVDSLQEQLNQKNNG